MTTARTKEVAWYDMCEAYEKGPGRDILIRTESNLLPLETHQKRGSKERMELRSRLVAREIKQKGTDSNFAGTPPLAFVRCLISRAARIPRTGKRRHLLLLKTKRAFLHADTLTEAYVKPPHLRHQLLQKFGNTLSLCV